MQGVRVLVTAHRRADELGAALERRGATVVQAPALSIIPHVDDAELVRRTHELLADPPDIVVATTGVGFRGWLEAAEVDGVATELLEMLRRAQIIARGPKARGAVQGPGLAVDWVAESETSAEVKEYLAGLDLTGRHVAVQHHGAGDDGLDDVITALGARVTPLVVYRWGPSPDPDALAAGVRAVAAAEVDAVVFTSAPAVTAFFEAADAAGVGGEVVARLQEADGVVAAAVGPVCAAPLTERDIEALVPDRYRLGALVRQLSEEFAARAGASVETIRGPLRLFPRAASLDGRLVPLSAGSLAVLRLLVDRPGQVVTRADIVERLPGASVTPHAAEVAVGRLRAALEAPDLVQTVTRRGYRLALA